VHIIIIIIIVLLLQSLQNDDDDDDGDHLDDVSEHGRIGMWLTSGRDVAGRKGKGRKGRQLLGDENSGDVMGSSSGLSIEDEDEDEDGELFGHSLLRYQKRMSLEENESMMSEAATSENDEMNNMLLCGEQRRGRCDLGLAQRVSRMVGISR
jgi:hypothetical protein